LTPLPIDYFARLTSQLPNSVPVVDLQAGMVLKITGNDVFLDGHYRASLDDDIGAAVARTLCAGPERLAPVC